MFRINASDSMIKQCYRSEKDQTSIAPDSMAVKRLIAMVKVSLSKYPVFSSSDWLQI
jgi:hypothetical protein